MSTPSITLAMTGASGAQYGLRLLQILLQKRIKVYFLCSRTAHLVIKMDMGLDLPKNPKSLGAFLAQRFDAPPELLQVCGEGDWLAPIASGTGVADAMVICPCTAGTLAALAAGLADTLLRRAADVCLKEQKKLLIVPRETPCSIIQLENMLKLARAGAVIMPASPAFYNHPQTLDDMVDFMVGKILDQLHINHQLQPVWGGAHE